MTRSATYRGTPPNDVKTGVPEVDKTINSMFPTPIQSGLSEQLAATANLWKSRGSGVQRSDRDRTSKS
jgi:hypothetical protein